MLIKEGYSPISTDAPESVLQVARTVRPAVILVDVLMPGLDGWDVVATLKSDPATAGIPVIMMSVLDSHDSRAPDDRAPILSKPFDSHTLKAALTAAMDERLRGESQRAAVG
jgi:CheY-like chemotaxis protein